jgi:hypothetical protein
MLLGGVAAGSVIRKTDRETRLRQRAALGARQLAIYITISTGPEHTE